MPPVDELPVNASHIDASMHIFITNKKNIHVNMYIDQFCLNPISDLLAASCNESSDIAIFTMKEGKNLYSLEYVNDTKPTFVKHKYTHDQGYF